MNEHPEDRALAQRLEEPHFARAYDLWLLVLSQQAAEIELTRRRVGLHRPPRSRVRSRSRRAQHRVPRTA